MNKKTPLFQIQQLENVIKNENLSETIELANSIPSVHLSNDGKKVFFVTNYSNKKSRKVKKK